MADETLDKKAREEANAAAIAKQAAQDMSGPQGQPDIANTISALDTLAANAAKEKELAVNAIDEEGGDAGKEAAAKAEADKAAKAEADKAAKAEADKAAADADKDAAAKEAAAKAEADKAAADAAKPGHTPEDKTPEQKAAEEAAAQAKQFADELFKDSPTLPPKASAKSAEAFQSVKTKAAQEISKLRTDLEAHTKELESLRSATKEALTPEVKAEIESLREFRAKLDIETDPRFKTFDTDITKGDAFIYAQLGKSPLFTAEVKKQIVDLGGPSKVKMDAILDGIGDPLTTRLVEGKLAELEVKNYEKQQAIEAAKGNVKGYLEQRAKEWEASTNSHTDATKAELDALAAKLPWLTPMQVAANATAEQKKAAESHNAFANKTTQEIQLALKDDSPEMRATLIVGMAQLFRLQNTASVLTAERDSLKKALDTTSASLAKLKGASTGRLRDGGGLPSGEAPKIKPKADAQFNETVDQAFDRIRKEKADAQAG